MVPRAGAIMVDTMIRLNPVADITLVTSHFLFAGQSLGFSESGDELNVTRNGFSGASPAYGFFSGSRLVAMIEIKEFLEQLVSKLVLLFWRAQNTSV